MTSEKVEGGSSAPHGSLQLEAIQEAGADWSAVRKLVTDGLLVETGHGGHRFYVRRLNRRSHSGGGGEE